MQNSVIGTRITSLYESQTLTVGLWRQNSVLRSRMTLVYWSQPSSVVLCIQNSDFSIRITSIYGSQHSSVVLCNHNSDIMTRTNSLYGSRPHLLFCGCKTVWLAPELLVSMGPSLHLWILHAKQRLLEQNYKSLWVPDFDCWFVKAKQRA